MSKIQKMVDYAVAVAKDDSHGYSQYRRWPSQGTDFDCSSLMYQAANHAGYNVTVGPSGTHYTGSMLADFKKAGFTAVPFDGNLSDLEPGDIMLNVGAHTEMYIGDGKFVGAHIAETGDIDGKPGDQTGNEISICPAYIYSSGWDYVLVPPKESGSAATQAQSGTSTVSSSKTRLNGIDIASYQEDLVPSKMSTTDFIIVKATGGTGYANPSFKSHADATLKAGKLLGCYHFMKDGQARTSAVKEADYFIAAVKPYVGKATLWLDYEADALYAYSVADCKAWLDRVKEKTGSTPGIYMSKSTCRERDWSPVVKAGYPLWCAQYAYKYQDGTDYVSDPWTDSYGFGAWESATVYQYSSEGRVSGYSSRLDLDLFYGSKEDWNALAGGKTQTVAQEPSQPAQTTKKTPVKYRSSTDKSGKKWLSTLKNIQGEGYSGTFGKPMRWLAIDGVKRYRVCTEESGWLPWVNRFDITDLDEGCAGDGSPITGIQVDDATCHYAAHVMRGKGKWYADMHGLVDSGGSSDNFAGDLANRIDAFRAKRA